MRVQRAVGTTQSLKKQSTILCIPGMKESRSQYKMEDRDVVYLTCRPGADFGTAGFAAKCLKEVQGPSSSPRRTEAELALRMHALRCITHPKVPCYANRLSV